MRIFAVILFAMVCGCGKEAKPVPTVEETTKVVESEQNTYEGSYNGVIVALDTEKYTISIYNILNRETLHFVYNGATDIQNKYGDIRAMGQMNIGDLVEGVYEKSTMKLKMLKETKDAWVYTNVTGFSMDRTNLYMEFSGGKYKYDSSITIVSEGKLVEPSEINSVDELTIRGIGTQIYSIQITRGHGYISLENEDSFYGGLIMINNDIAYQVSSHMLMVVPEGECSLEITKGNAGGKIPVSVKRNEEIKVDVQGFQKEARQIGSINFAIIPSGATLKIDGKETPYENLVELPYGSYQISVEAEGYVTYEADLLVEKSFQKRTITLGRDGEEAPEETTTLETVIVSTTTSETAQSTTTETSKTEPEETTTEKQSSDDQKNETASTQGRIHITQPSGVEVYFDGEYMGTAPVSFSKVTGEHTIILKQAGYVNKTYTVDIGQGIADAYYSFPQLEQQ